MGISGARKGIDLHASITPKVFLSKLNEKIPTHLWEVGSFGRMGVFILLSLFLYLGEKSSPVEMLFFAYRRRGVSRKKTCAVKISCIEKSGAFRILSRNLLRCVFLRRGVSRNLAAPIRPFWGVPFFFFFLLLSFFLLFSFFFLRGWKPAPKAKIWAQFGEKYRQFGEKYRQFGEKYRQK